MLLKAMMSMIDVSELDRVADNSCSLLLDAGLLDFARWVYRMRLVIAVVRCMRWY